ncbi:MAG TPA: isoprenylcysteine carboxylmethyltransferase family protein [Caulobacterales bacterium]|nr:isoprenylcysteine carboxylmethyltransferase family protein [Caulobacterales bacterium]
MSRIAVFLYGVVCYGVFLGVFLYAIGFVDNLGTPTALDGPPAQPLIAALAIDLGLLAVFALQHSGMARPAFKRWWTRAVPEAAERSTYVLVSSLAMIALFLAWQPIGGTVWNVRDDGARVAIYAVYFAGWAVLLYATFLIDHFDLFGLKQVWRAIAGKAYQTPQFRTPGLYKIVRHPLYVGWLMIFWATPEMTVAHLVFAVGTTGYILIAIQLEERDLVALHGEKYVDYRRKTPMLVPGTKIARSSTPPEAARRV